MLTNILDCMNIVRGASFWCELCTNLVMAIT